MQNIEKVLKKIKTGEVGIIVYSTAKQKKLLSLNEELSVPLASAGKVAIAFCVVKLVEERHCGWDDIITDVHFNPKEDSKEIYPHLQKRETLLLREAVEVMIACHDSLVANSIVQFCGGLDKINRKIKSHFMGIDITQNPRDEENKGEIKQVFDLLLLIYEGYKKSPELWSPVINGLVRQRGEIEGIPAHHFNHMTGGLDSVVVDMGMIGEFSENPFLFVLGAKNLPNRNNFSCADDVIIETIKLLYNDYEKANLVSTSQSPFNL